MKQEKQEEELLDTEELERELTKWMPINSKSRYLGLVKKMLSGTILSAIRLKCLDCTCYQESDIRNCKIKTCALWPFRMRKNPFRKRRKDSGKPPLWIERQKDES